MTPGVAQYLALAALACRPPAFPPAPRTPVESDTAAPTVGDTGAVYTTPVSTGLTGHITVSAAIDYQGALSQATCVGEAPSISSFCPTASFGCQATSAAFGTIGLVVEPTAVGTFGCASGSWIVSVYDATGALIRCEAPECGSITISSREPTEGRVVAVGTFEAAWPDQGNGASTVTGTFDIDVPCSENVP